MLFMHGQYAPTMLCGGPISPRDMPLLVVFHAKTPNLIYHLVLQHLSRSIILARSSYRHLISSVTPLMACQDAAGHCCRQ
jgi:hypothetical protein